MWLRRQQNPRHLSSPVSFRRFYLNFFRGLSISLEWSCCRLPPSINGAGMPSSSSTLPLAATAVNCSVVLPLFSSLPQSHSENGRGRNSFSLSGSDSVGSNNSIPSSLPLLLLFSILKQHSAPSTRPTYRPATWPADLIIVSFLFLRLTHCLSFSAPGID